MNTFLGCCVVPALLRWLKRDTWVLVSARTRANSDHEPCTNQQATPVYLNIYRLKVNSPGGRDVKVGASMHVSTGPGMGGLRYDRTGQAPGSGEIQGLRQSSAGNLPLTPTRTTPRPSSDIGRCCGRACPPKAPISKAYQATSWPCRSSSQPFKP